jgi:hypothetical protein
MILIVIIYMFSGFAPVPKQEMIKCK